MKIIAFIMDERLVGNILKDLELWEMKARLPPEVEVPSITISIDDSDFQIPFSAPPFYPAPDYAMDSYRISEPKGLTPMIAISAMNHVFPTPQKSEDLISIYSHDLRHFYP